MASDNAFSSLRYGGPHEFIDCEWMRFAGVLLLIYRPFGINDRINISNQEGIVVNIDLRYTMLDNDTTRILIPNSVLFTNPIVR